MTQSTHRPDPSCCPDCGALYPRPHKPGCVVVARPLPSATEIEALRRMEVSR